SPWSRHRQPPAASAMLTATMYELRARGPASVAAACLLLAACAGAGRDTSRAASPQAAEVIRTFEGRGVMADGSSPTPPDEALERFRLRDGVAIELVV